MGLYNMKKKKKEKTKEVLPLIRKHRPKTLEEFYGNKSLKKSLLSKLKKKSGVPQTFLLHGPSGCGKTTLARIIARMLKSKEVKEYNISKMRGIDTARSIIDMISLAPLRGKSKVIVLNECHKATNEFQNAMLEVLEEPPKNVYFILCTTEPEKLLPTIKGQRALDYKVELLDKSDMVRLLSEVIDKEEKGINIKVLYKINERSEGSPRKALNLLEKIIDIEDKDEQIQLIDSFMFEEEQSRVLFKALLESRDWETVNNLYRQLNVDADDLRYHAMNYMQAVLKNSKKQTAITLRAYEVLDSFIDRYNFYAKAQSIYRILFELCMEGDE